MCVQLEFACHSRFISRSPRDLYSRRLYLKKQGTTAIITRNNNNNTDTNIDFFAPLDDDRS